MNRDKFEILLAGVLGGFTACGIQGWPKMPWYFIALGTFSFICGFLLCFFKQTGGRDE